MDTSDTLKTKLEEILPPHDTSVDAILRLPSGTEYELLSFDTEFQQSFDYKGEPQQEVKGGLLIFTISHASSEELNSWMFGNNVAYSGLITFAPFSRFATPPLIVSFTDGYCVSFQKNIGELGMGITLSLVISARQVIINGIDHQNDLKYTFKNTH